MQDVIKILLMILVSWMLAELIKISFDFYQHRKFKPNLFLHYGGFPSAHTTLVTSLAFSIFLVQGLTVSLLISLALMAIVIRDLVTLREFIDQNSRNIAMLSNNKIETRYISHTFFEIIAGLIIGILVPSLIYLFLG